MREVEVLRDQLRHAFEADPDLHPHDVIVMAPEIELYGPFIEAVFGAPEFEPSVTPSYIPYRVSDRSLRRDAPTLEAFLAVLHLTAGRLTIEEVFDLLQADAVRARFGLTTADLDRAKRWARESGVRWGISGEHRAAAFSQPGFGENTWRFGLDRLLLGYAMPGRDDRLFADTGVVPYDEIEGHDALVLGRFAHFCETLFAQLTALRGPRPASAWQDALRHMLDALTVADDTTDYERQIIVAALGRLTELTALGGFAGPLDREVVRRFLEAHFARERHAVGFVSGAVTFCNLLPMRTIPFKIVCLLGMDDDRIPRPSQTLNFDLLRAKRLAGDRSLRDEDRYMFLEALLAARQRLIITYVGQSIRDNSVRPPSVLVSELLDVLGDGFRLPHTDGESLERRRAAVRDHLVVRHPLQEFSPRYFRADKDERLRNYHDTACRGARMLLDKNTPEHAAPPIFIDERNLLPLAADETVVVRLEDLHQFFKDPAKYLLERRLDLLASRDPDETAEREPLVLDGLEKYQLGELMLARELKEDDLEAYLPRVRALGKLPLGAMGEAQFAQLAEPVRRLAAAARASTTGGKLPPLDIDLAFDDARVSGRIGDIWPAARVIAAYASSKAERELRLWINHLFLLASAAPGYPRRSVFVGRDSFSFSGCDADPREFAADLLRIFLAGRQRPIRFFPEVSRTYADSAQTKPPADALREAEKKWRAHPQSDREAEAEKPKIRRLYGEVDPLRDPIDDPGLSFAALAVRVWGPLLRNRREGEK
jgi:exodeoxyribonuclease V gamma subunit